MVSGEWWYTDTPPRNIGAGCSSRRGWPHNAASMSVKTYRLGELLDCTFPPENNLIDEGLLPVNGIMVIGGPPKAYKSFVMGTIITHLACGTNLFGATRVEHGRKELAFGVARPCRVLLFEQEIGEQDLRGRYADVVKHLEPAHQRLIRENVFTHSCDHTIQLDTELGLGMLDAAIKEHAPDVLCLDPLIEFHTSDENSTKDMSTVLRAIDHLRERHGFATIMNHHTGKPSQDKHREGPDQLRGNSVIFGKGDSYLMIKHLNKDCSIIGIDFTVRRGKPITSIQLRLDWESLQARYFDWGKKLKGAKKSEEKVNE